MIELAILLVIVALADQHFWQSFACCVLAAALLIANRIFRD